MNIVTLTLNPAFDLHCYADAFKPYHENIFNVTARDAGGKGINVSRALSANGVENAAVCIVGNANGAEFLSILRAEGLEPTALCVEGRIRENITLHEKAKPETRISFPGFSVDTDVLVKLRDALGASIAGSTVVFAGSAPAGLSEESLVAFLSAMKAEGAALVIDSRSISMAALERLRPMLIKPNKEEAQKALNLRIDSLADAAFAAKLLRDRAAENVLLSLGGEGALLASASGVYYAAAPRIAVRSTIGAGDSTLAGFLSAVSDGCTDDERLCRAVAFGSAACLLEGTAAPRAEDIARLLSEIRAEHL